MIVELLKDLLYLMYNTNNETCRWSLVSDCIEMDSNSVIWLIENSAGYKARESFYNVFISGCGGMCQKGNELYN